MRPVGQVTFFGDAAGPAGMKLRESPQERIKAVTLGLVAHKSGPNVMAGIAIGGILNTLSGFAPWWWGVLTVAVWSIWVILYAVADEFKQQIEERKNRLLEPESQYYGIE